MTEKKIVSLQEYKIRQQRRILPILKYLMRKTSLLLTILPLLLCKSLVFGQISKGNFDQIKLGNFNPGYEQNVNRWNEVNEDTLKGTSKMEVPEGIYVWNIDPLFGDITPTQLDTLMHGFQNEGSTRGKRGGYLVTGNLGSPRHSLRLQNEEPTHWNEQFIFMNPYDFFAQRPFGQVFTNTKSPFTNITYHECGDKEHGEDRITALFAVNAGKRLGMGFNVDYLYGRGYFQSQNTAHFMGNLYASYIGERYKAHIAYRLHHLKTSENGGIEDDRYITEPEAFTNSYETWDMPTS
ncbi:MAG: putative porin, partial [Prevotellamassilia sp.]|nr:putative porin [Prevotellamassilia sp.]